MGEMKRGKAFEGLLSRSPLCLSKFFKHCRSLAFKEKPDYAYLRGVFRQAMHERGWEYDWKYDWWYPAERGTILPDEYRFNLSLAEPITDMTEHWSI